SSCSTSGERHCATRRWAMPRARIPSTPSPRRSPCPRHHGAVLGEPALSQLGEPLTYPLAGLLREPPGTTRLYPVAGVTIDLGPEMDLADPIEGTVRVSRTNRGVLVNGRLDTAIASQC